MELLLCPHEELEDLLYEADLCPELQGKVRPENKKKIRMGVYKEGRLVGFFSPMQDPDKIWQMGGLYIRPQYRNLGIGTECIAKFMKNRPGREYIPEQSIAPQKAYHHAGFHCDHFVNRLGAFCYTNY